MFNNVYLLIFGWDRLNLSLPQNVCTLTSEEAKQNKRLIDRASRQVEKERVKIENNERKMVAEIKDLAKKNKHEAAKIMAKDLVRVRHQINMYYNMSSQLKAIAMKMSIISTNATITNALKTTTKTMGKVNATMDIKTIQAVLKAFTKESAKMEMNQEVMNDAIDQGMSGYDDDTQVEGVYKQICDEVGVDYKAEAGIIPTNPLPVPQQPVANPGLSELEKQLNDLKK